MDASFYMAQYPVCRPSSQVGVEDIMTTVMAQYETVCSSNPGASIVVAGDSAGGWIVTNLLLRTREANTPVGAVLLSPWLDVEMTSRLPSTITNSRTDFMVREFIEIFTLNVAGTGGVRPFSDLLREVSGAGIDNLLVVAGGGEIMLDEIRALYVAARRGEDVTLYVGGGSPHIFVMSPLFQPAGLDGDEEVWAVMAGRVRKWLGQESNGDDERVVWGEAVTEESLADAKAFYERAVK